MAQKLRGKDLVAHLNLLETPTTVEEADAQKTQLLAWKLEVETDLDEIQQQLDEAKTRARTNSDYSDPEWFHRTNYALRAKKRLAQQIQACLAKLKPVRHRLHTAAHVTDQAKRTIVVHLNEGDSAGACKDQIWRALCELIGSEDPAGRTFQIKVF